MLRRGPGWERVAHEERLLRMRPLLPCTSLSQGAQLPGPDGTQKNHPRILATEALALKWRDDALAHIGHEILCIEEDAPILNIADVQLASQNGLARLLNLALLFRGATAALLSRPIGLALGGVVDQVDAVRAS